MEKLPKGMNGEIPPEAGQKKTKLRGVFESIKQKRLVRDAVLLVAVVAATAAIPSDERSVLIQDDSRPTTPTEGTLRQIATPDYGLKPTETLGTNPPVKVAETQPPASETKEDLTVEFPGFQDPTFGFPGRVQKTKEGLTVLPNEIVVVDFTPSEPKLGAEYGIILNKKHDKNQIPKKVAELKYPSEVMGPADFVFKFLRDEMIIDPIVAFLNSNPEPEGMGPDFLYKLKADVVTHAQHAFLNSNPEIASAFEGWKKFSKHWEISAGTIQDYLKSQELTTSLHWTSLENAIKLLGFGKDDCGNTRIGIEVDQRKIIEQLHEYPEQKLVVIPFQVGEIEFTVINCKVNESGEIGMLEKPYMVIDGAYTKQKAKKNMPRLLEIARAYPERLIIVASGNAYEDFTAFPPEKRDPNLLICAPWNSINNKPHHNIILADLYIDDPRGNGSTRSSANCGALSAEMLSIMNIYLQRGEDILTIKAKLLEAAEPIQWESPDGRKHEARVFNSNTYEKLKDEILLSWVN